LRRPFGAMPFDAPDQVVVAGPRGGDEHRRARHQRVEREPALAATGTAENEE